MRIPATLAQNGVAVALATAALVLSLAPATRADDPPPLPGDIATSLAFPGYAVGAAAAGSEAGVRAWLDDLRRWLRTYPADPRRPALESACLLARRNRLHEPPTPADWQAVARLYPTGVPDGAVAWLRAADAAVGAVLRVEERIGGLAQQVEFGGSAGGAPEAASALEAARAERARLAEGGLDAVALARAAAGRVSTIDLSDGELAHLEGMRREMARAPLVEARLLETLDRHEEAAAAYEELADDPVRAALARRTPASLWEKSAVSRRLAGQKARSQRDIRRALETVEDPQHRVWYEMWRLYNDHDMLNAAGYVGGSTGWGGDAFVEDARAMIRGLSGNPYLGKSLLTLGSTAFANKQHEAAIDFYVLALNDPAFMDQLAADPDLAKALLVAFPAALQLGRFEEAARILDAVTGLGTLTPEEEDALRAQLEILREAKVGQGPRATPPDEPPEADTPAPAGVGRGGGRLGRPEAAAPPAEEPASGPAPDGTVPPWPWVALGLGVVGIVLLMVRRR
jgi:tetratricopeptide (TPR) repeat protein